MWPCVFLELLKGSDAVVLYINRRGGTLIRFINQSGATMYCGSCLALTCQVNDLLLCYNVNNVMLNLSTQLYDDRGEHATAVRLVEGTWEKVYGSEVRDVAIVN